MDFYDRIGLAALGSRLRRLGDRLAEDVKPIYALYGSGLQPRWFPVVYLLSESVEKSITAIADDIGHSHASVSQIVNEMVKDGFARLTKGASDGRKTFVALTAKGRAAARKLNDQCVDVAAAVKAVQSDADADLWRSLAAFEKAIAQKDLHARVLRERSRRENAKFEIVDYERRFATAFRKLNEQWIKAYFTLEDGDRRVLTDPDGTILRPGGYILIALFKGKPVGTCALMKHGEKCFELAKMAVTPAVRGKGLGWLLGQAAIQKAASAGATRLYLESNRRLATAISLYRKLGFEEIAGEPAAYARCDIQMERRLR